MAISYEEFKDAISANLISYLGDDFEDYQVRFNKVKKVNRTLDGFSILKKSFENSDECVIAPTLYAEDFYEDYLESDDLNEVLSEISRTISFGFTVADVNAEPFTNMVNSLDKIIFQVVNTKRNAALLEDLPHKEFLDLSIIYRMIAGHNDCGITSALINHSVFSSLEISEDELFDLALENTKRLFPYEFKSMDDVVVKVMKSEGKYSQEVDEQLAKIPSYRKLYVISNAQAFCGATALLYPEVLEDAANRLDSDIYILPVSINEVMIIEASPKNKIARLLEMIKMSNNSSDDISDILSDNLYKYSRDSKKVTIPYAI